MARAVLLIFVFSSCLFIPRTSRAETPREQAGVLFKQGNKTFMEGGYSKALVIFQKAYRLYPSFKLDYNIAATMEELGRLREAAGHYQRFLVLGRDKSPTELVNKALGRLRLLRTKLASLRITCDVKGASVWVDRKHAGKTPLRLRVFLEPGRHSVQAATQGKPPFESEVALKAGEHRDLSIKLDQAQKEAKAVVPKEIAADANLQPRPDDDISRARRSKTLWGYIAMGVGGASTLTAAILYGVGGSQGEEAYDNYQKAVGDAEITRYHGEVEDARKKLIAGHVLMGVAAAAFGVSIYQFLTRPTEDKQEFASTVTAVIPLLGGAALSFSGGF